MAASASDDGAVAFKLSNALARVRPRLIAEMDSWRRGVCRCRSFAEFP
jgi:hypothetical protein